jgi:hypothetical protein
VILTKNQNYKVPEISVLNHSGFRTAFFSRVLLKSQVVFRAILELQELIYCAPHTVLGHQLE